MPSAWSRTPAKPSSQEVYQILAGYPDGTDADALRDDPLFNTLLDIPADDEERKLASRSTLNRFHIQ